MKQAFNVKEFVRQGTVKADSCNFRIGLSGLKGGMVPIGGGHA